MRRQRIWGDPCEHGRIHGCGECAKARASDREASTEPMGYVADTRTQMNPAATRNSEADHPEDVQGAT